VTGTDSRLPERATGPDADVGTVLRRARELSGLELEELARRLRLEPRVLRMLEGDLFEELPAPAFARGYVRALARELALDDGPLLRALAHRLADRTPALTDFETRAPLQVTSDSHLVRYTTLALILIMAVLVVSWWRSAEHDAPVLDQAAVAREESALAAPARADTPPLPYSYRIVTHPDTPSYRAPDPPAAAGADVPGALAGGTADLEIAAREDAWVQVLDVNGERLYYNLIRAGNRIDIAGRRPYSLVIGNAPAVSIRFEGRPVDVEAISSEGVARFQLGGTPPTTR
jgi:cytoskeleton protein RodZ